jgi:hypothetical protein
MNVILLTKLNSNEISIGSNLKCYSKYVHIFKKNTSINLFNTDHPIHLFILNMKKRITLLFKSTYVRPETLFFTVRNEKISEKVLRFPRFSSVNTKVAFIFLSLFTYQSIA